MSTSYTRVMSRVGFHSNAKLDIQVWIDFDKLNFLLGYIKFETQISIFNFSSVSYKSTLISSNITQTLWRRLVECINRNNAWIN